MAKSDSDSVFLTSITDLMTSLAVIFILLLVVYVGKAHAEAMYLREQLNGMKDLQDFVNSTRTAKEELKKLLMKQGLPFENDPNDALAIVYCAPESKLQFDKGLAVLKPEGKRYLQQVIPSVMEVLTSRKMLPNVESILVEGHTDSTGDDAFNLKLSQERAFAVLQYGISGCNLDEHRREWFLYFTSINGRGERGLLPVGAKAGREDEQRSRRVEFKIRVKSVEQKTASLRSLVDRAPKSYRLKY